MMTISHTNSFIKSTNVRVVEQFKVQTIYLFFSLLWIVSRPLAKYVVKKLFFTPQHYKMSEKEKQMIQKAKPFKFQSGGRTIQGYQWGKGPAVLFIHGWAGCGIQFYEYFELFVKAGFSVFTFDHVGHGNSDGKTSNYFEFSNAVYQFMTLQKKLDVKAIVAHSLGASAVINYLWRTGQGIKTILIAPALPLVDTLDHAFFKYGVPLSIFKSLLKDIEKETGHEFEKENPIDQIKLLCSDILIVHDTADRAISYEESWKASLLQDNIRLYSTHGLGHIRILKDKALANQIIRNIKTREVSIADC
ncbi:MAG: alpha/beta hydrolase [Proteobacteria bacterium]|nr:alpha/beta hydrolase [Pseudomonadota bacterium]MBU1583928.1 alpha/beta hydrolase [Pseudomonadota bacterium]MBU2454318.1 alpha/beta hydrolase [Pseudomonadota bacterium]MBU2627391.1 alpha/beta hydrolase [Pseudomonadota bacterium]